jgi:4-aminobutyrate aminotransferase-like enzyme
MPRKDSARPASGRLQARKQAAPGRQAGSVHPQAAGAGARRTDGDVLVRTPLPGPKGAEYLKKDRLLFAGDSKPDALASRMVVLAAQRDGYLWDVDGNRFIDFGAGWGTNNVGHAPAEVIDAALPLLRDFGVVCCSQGFVSYIQYELAEKLLQALPPHIQRVTFCATGTEAAEGAIKFMRAATGRPNVISFHAAYHGLSHGALAAGPLNSHMRDAVVQATPGFVHTSYATCYRCPFHLQHPACNVWCADYIEEYLLQYVTPPDSIAGILVEPIQGEGGIWVPPDDYLPRLERMCRKHGWLLCIDEVESGFGRSGKMWAFEHFDVKPDIVVIGKGLSGSILPIAAIAGTPEAMAPEVAQASTYAGQPASCAAGIKALERIKRERIVEHAARLGEIGLKRLRQMKERYSIIGDVRGRGLFLAVEFVRDRQSKERLFEAVKDIYIDCMHNGLYFIYDSISWFARFLPVLDIREELFLRGLDIFEAAVAKAEAKYARPAGASRRAPGAQARV